MRFIPTPATGFLLRWNEELTAREQRAKTEVILMSNKSSLKILTVLLSIVLLFSFSAVAFASSESADFGSYDSVVIIGVDGAGAFFKQADTPNCDRIFAENSAVSYDAKAEYFTSSAPNWGSILMGVSYHQHRLINDTVQAVERTSNEEYPSIFRLAREKYPNAELAAICNWNPINIGIIENDLNVYKNTAGTDDKVCEIVTYYLNKNAPKLLFVQFDSCDHAGHASGYGSSEHLSAISNCDSYIGQIYDCLKANGRAEKTLFMVVADHGGTPGTGNGGSHGGLSKAEYTVFLGVNGKGVCNCRMNNAKNRDVAAIALYALGIGRTADMTARVPDGLFEGVKQEKTEIEKREDRFEKYIFTIKSEALLKTTISVFTVLSFVFLILAIVFISLKKGHIFVLLLMSAVLVTVPLCLVFTKLWIEWLYGIVLVTLLLATGGFAYLSYCASKRENATKKGGVGAWLLGAIVPALALFGLAYYLNSVVRIESIYAILIALIPVALSIVINTCLIRKAKKDR